MAISLGSAGASGEMLCQSAIEQLVQNYGLAHDLFGGRGISIMEKVPTTQFDRVHSDGRGDFVDVEALRKWGDRRPNWSSGNEGNENCGNRRNTTHRSIPPHQVT